jgi:hypothetical protein
MNRRLLTGVMLVGVTFTFGCADDTSTDSSGGSGGRGGTVGSGGTYAGGTATTAGALPVGCEWFAGPNCWKAAVAEATTCVDGNSEGTFNADRSVCTYQDGTVIAFATPLPDDGYPEGAWNFSITSNGATCAEFEHLGPTGDDGLVLRTASGEFCGEVVGLDLVITCPGGQRVSIGAQELDDCPEGRVGISGGSSSGAGVLSVSFTLLGGEGNGDLWTCSDP